MSFEYMVAYLSGDNSLAMKIAVDQLIKLEVVSTRTNVTAEAV